ncbi:ABC transporter permease [Croceimicrobium sp.]|uniref:ABC transporter permease n=1 Tax=Croceimicrobium sp. TaxID=2828340 RepID=UPI003BAD2613
MLLSKLPFAFRTLYRHRLYTLLNLGGLAIGLAVSIIVALYLHGEFTYDEHWENHEDIYRVNSRFDLNGSEELYGGSGYGLAPLLAEHYKQVEASTHLFHLENSIFFRTDSLRQYEDQVAIADSNFFRVFRTPFIAGSPEDALVQPFSIVVSSTFADRYFGSSEVLGKKINTSNYEYTITGVIADLPENLHHSFQVLISEPPAIRDSNDLAVSLWQVSHYTFVKLKPDSDPYVLEAGFDTFFDKYMAGLADIVQGSYQIELQEIASLHFKTNAKYDRPGGRLAYVYGFAGIGLLILILAIINYVNMATARSLKRIREAAMRKVLGASRVDIRWLILSESVLMSFIALLLAFALVEVFTAILPFNNAIGKKLFLNFGSFPELLPLSVILALLVGLISGSYPAISLARVSPLDAFTNKKGIQRRNSLPRKFLVGFQVCVSVAVVITAIFMYRQMEFIKNRNLGFNSDHVLVINVQDSTSIYRIQDLATNFRRSSLVESVTVGASSTGSGTFRSLFELEEEATRNFRRISLDFLGVGPQYLETMEIPLLAGRGFRQEDLGDSLHPKVIVNRALVRDMHWERPLGKKIRSAFDESGDATLEAEVIGVCDDFNAQSLHNRMAPLILTLHQDNFRVLQIKVSPDQMYAALDDLERRWTAMVPDVPFQFSFLNKDLLQMYDEEMRQSRLILYLTIIAILISLLGFVGLASFTTGLRTKEIAIRNVLGAGSWDLVNLIYRELVSVILAGVIIATPLSIFITWQWLQNFAYRTSVEPLIIIFTVLLTLVIGYGIVAIHSLTVSRRNSIQNLV